MTLRPVTVSEEEIPLIFSNVGCGSRLFIRRCHPKLWKLVKAEMGKQRSHHRGVIITGNAGVGKVSGTETL